MSRPLSHTSWFHLPRLRSLGRLPVDVIVATTIVLGTAFIAYRSAQWKVIERSAQASLADSVIRDATTRLGPEGATVNIVAFSDLQCDACRIADERFRTVQRIHPTEVAFVFRHFPLTPVSLQAAIANECARRQGFFWTMQRALWNKQESHATRSMRTFAHEAHVRDISEFDRCLSDSSASVAVWTDTRVGDHLLVRTTPTFFVNGQRFNGVPNVAGLTRLVNRELRAARTMTKADKP